MSGFAEPHTDYDYNNTLDHSDSAGRPIGILL